MDTLPKSKILESKPDILMAVRKQYNLEKPGQMEEAVNILHEWVQQQKHFKKKDFSRIYYEICVITCKGSIERAKTQIDRNCTMRTLLPQFYGNYNVKIDFDYLKDVVYLVCMPKLTDDYYRVFIAKYLDTTSMKSSQFIDYFRMNIILTEYVKHHDYMTGVIMLLDFTEASLVDLISKIYPIELKQILSIIIEAYGIRIKGIHVVCSSKIINSLVAILKQVVSTKIASRIHVHKDIEDVKKHISPEILPKDYGGEERSLKELQNELFEELSSEENLKTLKEMNEASTDESRRRKDTFNEEYAGMPGTFRLLSVD